MATVAKSADSTAQASTSPGAKRNDLREALHFQWGATLRRSKKSRNSKGRLRQDPAHPHTVRLEILASPNCTKNGSGSRRISRKQID
jgi:hypothetical protein